MSINHLDTNGYWAVDGTAIYVPSIETKITTDNVVGSSSGRDESGLMHIDWKRTKVYKIFLVYRAMTASELATMMNLIVGKEFTFKFPFAGSTVTIDAYCGASDVTLYSYGIPGGETYTDVSMNVIQM